jgi:hypothetical protein
MKAKKKLIESRCRSKIDKAAVCSCRKDELNLDPHRRAKPTKSERE